MAVQGSDYFIIERSGAYYHVLASDILAYMEANLGTAQFEVADIAARNALGNVSVGDRVFVTDASADATVSSGWAVYMYRGSSSWTKVAEEESLDITLQDTDLGYTASATQGVVTSSTGDNATIPAADGTNAGLMVPAQFTKLAGIEAGADVTDTANVTAAGALMDSEVTNLADVKAFDPADYAPRTRAIATGVGLVGGGNLSADRTLSLNNTLVTPGSYGSASAVATFTVDQQGRLTAAGSTTISITESQISDLHDAVDLAGNANTNPLTISGQTLGFSISQLTAAP